jgi:hypothetical protein
MRSYINSTQFTKHSSGKKTKKDERGGVCNTRSWPGWRSRYNHSLRAGRCVNRIPVGPRFSTPLHQRTGPTQPPIQWVPVLLPEVRRPVPGIDNPFPSGAEVKDRVELYPCPRSWNSWTLLLPLCNAQRKTKLEVQRQI